MAGSPPDAAPSLRAELRDLALVATGAIPGALLRWRMEDLGQGVLGGLVGRTEADLAANLLGAFLIGLIAALPGPRARLMLMGGIGFCGSLTTFSGWMLQISLALRGGRLLEGLAVVVLSVLGGLAAVALGMLLGRRIGWPRLRRGQRFRR
jgi:CrcB protein